MSEIFIRFRLLLLNLKWCAKVWRGLLAQFTERWTFHRCIMVYRLSSIKGKECAYMNQQDAQKILVIRLYFLLDALHVSDYINPSSGATL